MDLNKVMLIGRLTKNAEVRSIPSGDMVASFSLATGRQWTDKATGQKKSQAEFHNIVAWRKLADVVSQYCRKGSQIYIEGHLQTRSWDDPTGKKQYRTEIVADNIILLGGRVEAKATELAAQQRPQQEEEGTLPDMPQGEEINPEDIPF